MISFSLLGAVALWQVGYLGLIAQQLTNYALQQILSDLVIAVFICMYWMWQEAKKSRRNPWPWMLLSLLEGSFGPMLYLITRKSDLGSVQSAGLAVSGKHI